MGRNDRPEHTAPPEIFYNEDEARKYTDNTRMIAIQTALTERAMELLALPQDGTPKLLLDLGCGSGLSGEAITEAGHMWMVGGSTQLVLPAYCCVLSRYMALLL
jgi:18S rRNA (guanine1575-N7)-methyltransferase